MSVRRLVLIADDDEDVLALVRATIERSGHEVMAVGDGAAALSAMAERRPDLAVLDIAMPELDGLEVLRRLRADDETKDLPVILLTAQAQAADVERGFATGASAYVRKPFSPRDLATRVDDLLA
ncbi:MAG TPA: response regulator [Gaiellaceae bacterium]|jgi:two-component system response regulator MtrA|nr:response regulator [Gaiellaceae bacterium]